MLTRNLIYLLFFIVFNFLSYDGIYAQQQFANLTTTEKQQWFKNATDLRIKDLEYKIRVIADKKEPRDVRSLAIEDAVSYFIDEDKIFEVSSATRGTVTRLPVRQYFSRLFSLPYSRVEIEWVQSRWITEFRKAPNGKWYATYRIYQRFTGKGPEGNELYTDLTQKDLTVELEILSMDKGDKKLDVLRVQFGDVRVIDTR